MNHERLRTLDNMQSGYTLPFHRALHLLFVIATWALWVAVAVGTPTTTQASPGDLDPTFGGTGKVTTLVGQYLSSGHALALQEDGKIVVVGRSSVWKANYGSGHWRSVTAILRYNIDGTLDTAFGEAGVTTLQLSDVADEATAVAIQGDGKIVVAAYTNNDYQGVFGVVRLNPDGTLDATFDDDGKAVAGFIGPYDDYAQAVALQSDGKIVVGGYVGSLYANDTNFALVRFNPDGSVDSSFGIDGSVATDVGAEDVANAMVIQADDKILLGGSVSPGGFAVARYDADGTLDTSFGNAGIATTTIAGFLGAQAGQDLSIQDDGKIVVAGYVDDYVAAVRFDADGTLDSGFGDNGAVVVSSPRVAKAYAVAIQSDGKIVLAGSAPGTRVGEDSYDLLLVRLNADGTLDTTFEGGGATRVNFWNKQETALDLALQSDGKLVATGWTEKRGTYGIAVARAWGANYGICGSSGPVPPLDCVTAAEATFRLVADENAARSRITWTMRPEESIGSMVLGAPATDTVYSMCIYDISGAVPSLAVALDVAPGGLWQDKGAYGWRFVDRTYDFDGIQRLDLKGNATGGSILKMIARGVDLPLPIPFSGSAYFDQDPAIVVQLVNGDGTCWSTDFSVFDTVRNTATEFKARTQ